MKKEKTPLEIKFSELPISIGRKGFLAELGKAGISERTWIRDREAPSNSIPVWRMQVYAALFECDLSELIDTYVKVKPLIKRPSLVKKLGLKN